MTSEKELKLLMLHLQPQTNTPYAHSNTPEDNINPHRGTVLTDMYYPDRCLEPQAARSISTITKG